jgi:mono/diheme cytochrome c family protein
MKKITFWLALVLILGTLVLSACGGGGAEKDTAEVIPANYAGKTNPFKGNADAASAGKEVYTTNCASCHGDSGKGDGPAGASLDPKAADLTAAAKEDGEDFFLWRISEGGAMAPFNSSMPAWKGILTEEQIWQVTSYIETWK